MLYAVHNECVYYLIYLYGSTILFLIIINIYYMRYTAI